MALITCPDCAHAVSDAASACPQCARPMRASPVTVTTPVRTKGANAAAKFVGFLMIVVGICLGIAGTYPTVGGVMAVAGFVGFIAARFAD